MQNSSDLITVVGSDATITYQSPSSEHVLGYQPAELLGTRFDRLVAEEDAGGLLRLLADGSAYARRDGQVIECTLRHRDGELRQFEILHTNLLDDEHVRGIVLNARDISERKTFEEQLAHQAFHDPVTNLANRALFVERVRHAIGRARREERALGVMFLDIDDFKTINDSLGHGAGDAALIDVAKRLCDSIRSSDTAARFGGDEFVVLLEDLESTEVATEVAERILEDLRQPLTVAGKELVVRGSIGISIMEGRLDRRRRRADPRRRRRDVHSQARRQGQLPDVRAGDARRCARAPGAARRPAAGARERPVRALLPADRPARRRPRRGHGGTAALAPPRARAGAPRRLHPVRRGDRADRPDRPLGAARGLPAGGCGAAAVDATIRRCTCA